MTYKFVVLKTSDGQYIAYDPAIGVTYLTDKKEDASEFSAHLIEQNKEWASIDTGLAVDQFTVEDFVRQKELNFLID